jgi:hypothetical protein
MPQHAHVEHFRGAQILCGEQVVGENIEGNLAHRDKPNGRKEWFGSFEISNDSHIVADSPYTLKLTDGREADIRATEIDGVSGCHRGMHAVMYYVTGPIRGIHSSHGMKRYGIDKGQRYLG